MFEVGPSVRNFDGEFLERNSNINIMITIFNKPSGFTPPILSTLTQLHSLQKLNLDKQKTNYTYQGLRLTKTIIVPFKRNMKMRITKR